MMFVLDTNVVSEARKVRVGKADLDWRHGLNIAPLGLGCPCYLSVQSKPLIPKFGDDLRRKGRKRISTQTLDQGGGVLQVTGCRRGTSRLVRKVFAVVGKPVLLITALQVFEGA